MMAAWANSICQIQLVHQFLVNMRAELLAACEHFERDVIETVPLHHDPGVLLVLGTAHRQHSGLTLVSDVFD
jgi:hypothetical protein